MDRLSTKANLDYIRRQWEKRGREGGRSREKKEDRKINSRKSWH